jgi:hypothetical protein
MYKELLNYYITKKDMKTLSKMISSMKKGYLKFNKKFIETNTVILGGLLFTRAQNFEKQSNYKVAIEEYIKLYEYEGYPIKIKMESALNIAIAYLKLNNTKSSYSWSKKSMKYYKNKYFSEKMPVYFQMAEKYFLLQDLERSKELYGKLFFNFCHMVKDRKLKSSHYAKFQNMNILTKSYKKYKLANKKANACKIDNKAREQVAAVYVEHVLTEQKYDEINKIKNQVEYKKYNYEIFNYYLSKLWMEENSLNGVNESKVFQSFSKFIDGNNFIKISDKNEISYYKEFLSYLNKVKNYNYEIAIKTPFDLNGFIKDIESKMIEFAKVKQIGDKLANRTKYPMAYVSIQAVQKMNIEKIYYVFSKLDLSKQVKEPQIKKQLDENIKNILSGFDQQRIAVSKNINDTIRKNKSLSGYSKYAYFDRELFETSLYQKDDMSLIYVGK